MEAEQHHEETNPEVPGPGHKPKLVEHIKEKFSAVKEKIIGHHDPSTPASPTKGKAHCTKNSERSQEPEPADGPSGAIPTTRGGVVSHPKYEDTPIPEGGLIMTAALDDPENPEEHHRFREKIKNVFSFPVPDTTVTPEKDFDETVPPNLKI